MPRWRVERLLEMLVHGVIAVITRIVVINARRLAAVMMVKFIGFRTPAEQRGLACTCRSTVSQLPDFELHRDTEGFTIALTARAKSRRVLSPLAYHSVKLCLLPF